MQGLGTPSSPDFPHAEPSGAFTLALDRFDALVSRLARLREAAMANPWQSTGSASGLAAALGGGDGLDAVLDALPERIYVKDTKNNNIWVNQAVADSLATTPETIAGTASERWYPTLHRRFYEADLEVIHSGLPKLRIVEPIPSADGVARTFETDKFPLRDDQGEVAGILVIARECCESDSVRQKLDHASRLVAIGELAGGAMHSFNNYLTIISGYLAAAMDERTEPDARAASLAAIGDAIEHAGELTANLLSLASPRQATLRTVDLDEVVADTVGLVRPLIPAEIRLQILAADEPPMVLAHPVLLGEVLINLVTNARDAMASGGLLVIASEPSRPLADGRAAWALRVSDSGSGIADDIRDTLFEPLVTTKREGTGLGLSSVAQIVDRLGGEIDFASTLGVGTQFFVRLPRVPGATSS